MKKTKHTSNYNVIIHYEHYESIKKPEKTLYLILRQKQKN